MFFYAGEWRISTAGGFGSEQAYWAMEWMKKNMPLADIDKTNTYLFEIVYPTNKIVVQYDYEGLVLLGIFDSYGLEYDVNQLVKEAYRIGTRCVKIYGEFDDMDSILKRAEVLDLSEEGYVIRFKSGIRLKIKGDEYVRVHKIISHATPLAIWETMLKGDSLEEIRKEMPEEMQKDFDTIISIFETKLAAFIAEVEELTDNVKSKSDKELGLFMQQHKEAFCDCEFKTTKGYIFTMRQGVFYIKLNDLDPKQLMRRKVFAAFKPKANYLEGYTPSSAMNRFNDL